MNTKAMSALQAQTIDQQAQSLRMALGLLTEDEVAAALEVTPLTLGAWRRRKYGPPFVRLGKRPWYRIADIVGYLEQTVGFDAEEAVE